MRTVRVGCSGWQYLDWREVLYPAGLGQARWLAAYAEAFDTVEVNATFYRLPSRDAVARWAEQTPPQFVFAVKASRYLIHMKKLKGIEQGAQRFFERLEPLVESGKLGPVLWQLPPWFTRDDDRLSGTLRLLPLGRHAFEFRHPSWFADDVLALLREHDVALAVGHDPRRAPAPLALTTDWTLLRFHYGERGRRGNYSSAELRAWARRIRRIAEEAEVFAYFNNDWEGFAVANALELERLLAESDENLSLND